MDTNPTIIAEKASHKVAAVFPGQQQAAAAAQALGRLPEAGAMQIRLLEPGALGVDRALEPDQGGIFRTILRAHAWLGLAGAVAGGLLFLVLWSAGIPMIVLSPFAAAGAMIGFGAVAGLIAGGLVSLRPDHDPYIAAVRGALDRGQPVVVVHAGTTEAAAKAELELAGSGGETVRTL